MELTNVLDGPCCKIRCITRGVGNGTPLPKFLQKKGATGVVAARLRSKAVGSPDRQALPKEWRTVLLHMEMLVKEGFEIATGGRVKLFTGKFSGIGEFKAGGWRVLFFLDYPAAGMTDGRYKDTIIITTCFMKDRPETPTEEKTRCLKLRELYHAERYGKSN